MVESPRYLVSKNRFEEANEIFKHISTYNNRPPYEFHLLQEMDNFSAITTQIRDVKEKPENIRIEKEIRKKEEESTFGIFSNRIHVFTTVKMLYAWFMRFFIYYSITLSTE